MSSIKDMITRFEYADAMRVILELMSCKMSGQLKEDIDSLKTAIDEDNAKEIFAIIKRI